MQFLKDGVQTVIVLVLQILRILEDAMRHFEMYTNLPGK